jgi:transcription antitermination factor NusA-like protein
VNALAPAVVDRVEIDAGRHTLLAVVPDDQLSLGIGKRGQNVRLASKLVGWEVDIKSRTEVDGPAPEAADEGGNAPDTAEGNAAIEPSGA